MVKIIFLNGFHGSGKDTLGRLIINNNPNYVRVAFADTAKDMTAKKHGFQRQLADIPEEKDKARAEYGGQSIRDLCRAIWMEIYATNKTMITEIVIKEMIEKLTENPEINFVITDFRYDHDYYKIIETFGKECVLTVKITRDCVAKPNKDKEPEEYALEQFTFDKQIENNGTYDELYNKIKDHL